MMVCLRNGVPAPWQRQLLSAGVNGANIQNQTVGAVGFRKREAMTGAQGRGSTSWRPDGLVADWDYWDQLSLRWYPLIDC